MHNVTTLTDQFFAAIEAAGLTPPSEVVDDGRIHRFSTNGKARDESGWYVLYSDGVSAGSFGDWRTGYSQTWSSKSTGEMTEAERTAHRQRVKAMQAERDAAQAQRHQQAAQAAEKLLEASTPSPAEHPYLVKKGVKPHRTMVDKAGYLLVPMRDTCGKLWNVERVNPADSKDKKGLPGGRRIGLYFAIGKPEGLLIVCEGFATGASIHESTGHAVAVAFNAGNLLAVAQALRTKYPELRIILAADDDANTPGNPGLTKATEAAREVGGLLAVPDFGADRPDGTTDFNDLHQITGPGAVKVCIDGAGEVSKSMVTKMVTSPGPFLSRTFTRLGEDETDDSTWAIPQPLPDGLPPVQIFDPELLPIALQGWVADIAHRMQCPPDFVAVAALTGLSGLIGARAVIAPKQYDDWRVVPNLWGLVVGKPGVMKSPALGQALAPLHRLEANERETLGLARESWAIDCKVAEMATEANEKRAKALAAKDPAGARALLESAIAHTPEPTARRFVVNDATVEKLADLLIVNPWGMLVFRDELHGLISSMDRAGQEGSRGFYLTAYDGNQGHAVDRIGRGESYVPRVCLAMLGGMQPGKLQAYVREAVTGGAGDDGLLQRFGMSVWPDVGTEYQKVDQWPDAQAKQAAWAVFERLATLVPDIDDEPVEWRFTPEAQALFWKWALPFETEIRGDELHPALISHLSKYRKLVPALALIFALVDTPDNGCVVGVPELMRALAWAEYLRTHAERIYSVATTPETAGAAALLKKIQAGKLLDANGLLLESFAPRDVAVKHWAGLSTPDAVRKAACALVDFGWLARKMRPSTSGRASELFLINPAALNGGHQ